MTEKVCLQEKYPDQQTPCFKAAGGPCEEIVCPVAGILKILVISDGRKISRSELHDMFHLFCIQSDIGPDARGFTRRVNERIASGQLE